VATGVGGLALLLVPGAPILVAPLAWSVAGLGMGLVNSAASLVVLEQAPGHRVGRASSALQLADVLGVALGTGLGGAALAVAVGSGWGRRAGLVLADVVVLVAALVALAATRELPGRAVTRSAAAADRGA
jgi:MFS family permease